MRRRGNRANRFPGALLADEAGACDGKPARRTMGGPDQPAARARRSQRIREGDAEHARCAGRVPVRGRVSPTHQADDEKPWGQDPLGRFQPVGELGRFWRYSVRQPNTPHEDGKKLRRRSATRPAGGILRTHNMIPPRRNNRAQVGQHKRLQRTRREAVSTGRSSTNHTLLERGVKPSCRSGHAQGAVDQPDRTHA